MDKSILIEKTKNFLNLEYELRNDIKEYLTTILANTSEDNPKDVYIVIDEEFYFGLSSLELPHVNSIWYDDNNDTIYFQIDYCSSPTDFDNMTTGELITIIEEIDYDDSGV